MISEWLKNIICIQIVINTIFVPILIYKIVERVKEKPKDNDELNKYKDL